MPSGGGKTTAKELKMLVDPKKIVKETEKAVAVANGAYADARATANYDVKELTRGQIETLKGGALVWLPKSQVTIEDGHVVDMPQWLANKNGFLTVEAQEKMNTPEYKHAELLAFCKANRVKGAREEMTNEELAELVKKAGFVGLAC